MAEKTNSLRTGTDLDGDSFGGLEVHLRGPVIFLEHASMAYSASTLIPAVPVQISARVLSRILIGHRLAFGSRVLLVGCGTGELASFLADISFEVSGIDDSLGSVEEAREMFPRVEFHAVRPAESVPLDHHSYDLVLVQECGSYAGNLLGLPARAATANLLACLKPCGHAVFVRPFGDDEVQSEERHQQNCWTRHLACFPGEATITNSADPWLSRSTWDWLRGRHARRGYYTVSWRAPQVLVSLDRWREFAKQGLMTGLGACCEAACETIERRVA